MPIIIINMTCIIVTLLTQGVRRDKAQAGNPIRVNGIAVSAVIRRHVSDRWGPAERPVCVVVPPVGELSRLTIAPSVMLVVAIIYGSCCQIDVVSLIVVIQAAVITYTK